MKINKINKDHSGFMVTLTNRVLIVKLGRTQVEVIR